MASPDWNRQLQESITSASALCERFPELAPQRDALERVVSRYPLLINPYITSMLRGPGDPLWRQAVPDSSEIENTDGMPDPLAEDRYAPVPNITHRYPDRALFLVSNRCALYCRFCTRKRKIGRRFSVTPGTIAQGLDYIRQTPAIRDVLISGGDPLLLADEELAEILSRVRAIKHVEIIRIGTRVPGVLPDRVTPELAARLARFSPLYINTHFNHPAELTPSVRRACGLLADAGIPLGCQTVLLRGINDSADVMRRLMRGLVAMRVRPYYLHHMDYTCGTAHFRTSITQGLALVTALRGHTSGMCVPHYVIDLPGGGGKIPLTPEYIQGVDGNELLIRNYQGRLFRYEVCREDADRFRGGAPAADNTLRLKTI